MGTNFIGYTRKFLPCLTACPWEAYKKNGLQFTKATYIENTFELGEILVLKGMNYDLTNKSAFYIEELRSVALGRCYMICPLNPTKRSEPVLIKIRKDRDLTGNVLVFYVKNCICQKLPYFIENGAHYFT